MNYLTKNTCPTCKCDLTGKNKYGIGRVVFCEPCGKKHSAKRLDRMSRDLLGPPFLAKRAKEMRQAVEERDRIRRELDAERARIRAEVEKEVDAKFRSLSFWSRLRLLFGRSRFTRLLTARRAELLSGVPAG